MSELFQDNTKEYRWKPSDSTDSLEYIVRFINDYSKISLVEDKDWPSLTLPWFIVEEPGEENSYHLHSIIGGVWDHKGLMIAFWSIDDEGHIEFYGLEKYPNIKELNSLTSDFNNILCPNTFEDSFDDGSGLSRKVRLLPDNLFQVGSLANIYQNLDSESNSELKKELDSESDEKSNKKRKISDLEAEEKTTNDKNTN